MWVPWAVLPHAGGLSSPAGSISNLTRCVIAGEHGNGEERKRRPCANCAAVQARVNELLYDAARGARHFIAFNASGGSIVAHRRVGGVGNPKPIFWSSVDNHDHPHSGWSALRV